MATPDAGTKEVKTPGEGKPEEEKTPEEKQSFFKQLLNRRVPQIIGIYIAISWGIIQFVDWIVNRYLYSPHLTDLALVILMSLIPSSVIVAYYHGRPGKDKWKKSEVIGIPLNVVITAFLVFTLFGDKDLGTVSQKITLKDETGKQIERTIPKTGFRKKVALFFYKNQTGDKSLDWLQYGLNQMLEMDIRQDMFVDVITPYAQGLRNFDYYVYRKMKEAGFKDGLGLPLLLKKKIAKEAHMDYFSFGHFSKQGDEFVLENSLYRTKDARPAATSEIRGKDIFELVDNLSVQLRHDLEIPTGHIAKEEDLPLAEMFTHSLSAARSFFLSTNSIVFDTDWKQAQNYLDEAVKEDPSFAMAYSQLSVVYIFTNQHKKWAGSYTPVMKHIYKLPERYRYYTKIGYFLSKGKMDKAVAVLEMIVKLYPEDLRAYSILALYYNILNRRDDSIATYKRILEIDPRRYEVFENIAVQYQLKGDPEEALAYYEKFARHFPQNPRSFLLLGQFHQEAGNFEKAKEYYEKALLLEPGNFTTLTILAGIEQGLGNFDEASRQLQEALEDCRTPRDRVDVYDALKDFHSLRGQKIKALEYQLLRNKAMREYMSPLVMAAVDLHGIDNYIEAGKEKEAFQALDDLKPQLTGSSNLMKPAYGYVTLYLALEKPDEAEKNLQGNLEEGFKNSNASEKSFWHFARARIHQLRGEYQEAIQRFEEYLKLRPTAKNTLIRLGRCYRQLKDYQKAQEHLKKMLRTNPFSPSTHYELGLLYLDKGNNEKALEHLKVAVDVWKDADPHFKPAQKAKEKLAQVQG
ncbi:MAG: DUF3808 domain-containing protein [bacterium]|nr:DUF3808 domain-containing protein [bacterium]